MIYPEFFPDSIGSNLDTNPEKMVFDYLKELSGKYEIFYSRRFRKETKYESADYEIDFIVIDPKKSFLLIEVKGGKVSYNGTTQTWTQNGEPMDEAPDLQVKRYRNNLLSRYDKLKSWIPVTWALCFPQCEQRKDAILPPNLNRFSIIDQKDILKMKERIEEIMTASLDEFRNKPGMTDGQYNGFKNSLLRDFGLVTRLGTQIQFEERIYIKLTNQQYKIFKGALGNKRIVVHGVAGSGKTIIAKELAKEFIDRGERVLLLCFNRPLADAFRSEFYRKYDEKVFTTSTFHHFARSVINDEEWWKSNTSKNDFWDIQVPARLDELSAEQLPQFDAIIVDEGQDFKEFWYELVERHLKKGGRFIVFLDKNQDVFNHFSQLPEMQHFMSYELDENCRNGKKIIEYLADNTGLKIGCMEGVPSGEILIKKYKDNISEFKMIQQDIDMLIVNDNIKPSQILILIHSDKRDSFLGDAQKISKKKLTSSFRQRDVGDNDIRYATINYYKGLEADIVFLSDTHMIKDVERKKLIYVEASRARFRLYVYEKE